MTFRSTCPNCGESMSLADITENFCTNCRTLAREAEQHFASENPGASESSIIYAGRVAMQTTRGFHARKNYTDPRQHSALTNDPRRPPV